jgi:hypothetical protein
MKISKGSSPGEEDPENYSGKEQPERQKQSSEGQRPWDEECPCDPTRSIEKPEIRKSPHSLD